MEIKVIQSTILEANVDAILVNLYENASPAGGTGMIDKALNGGIGELIHANDLEGKLNEVAVLYTRGALPSARVIVVGQGKVGDLTLDRIREAAASGARKARTLGCKSIGSIVFGGEHIDLSQASQATVEGMLLGLYRWRANHTMPADRADIQSIQILEPDAARMRIIETGVGVAQAVAAGVYRTRDLVNQSPNQMTPEILAKAAFDMSASQGIKCTIRDIEWIRSQGMNAFLAVNQGSANPPRFIELEYNGSEDAPIIFIGKGLTFDSGGISLKGAEGMEDMRDDMAGAAAVIGAFEAISRLKLPLHIVGLIAATENLPSGTASRPGDVVRARNGKTIEIVNTDAEGRLTLADVLSYAADFNPQAVIDLATLTGACVTALGENVAAGYFSNDESLVKKVEEASRISGEKLWRLPLYPDYRDKIRSDYADLKNTGGAKGGVGSSAVFLQQFTSYPWTHWDIAGVVLDKVGTTPLYPFTHPPHVIRGATGFGVRALVSLARNWR